jgi:hypothetical protein
MRKYQYRWLKRACSLAAGGALLQLGACQPKNVAQFVSTFNPCGTILNCDPIEYNFVASGYDGPGVDFDVDPTCTYPPFCGPNAFTPAVPAAAP